MLNGTLILFYVFLSLTTGLLIGYCLEKVNMKKDRENK